MAAPSENGTATSIANPVTLAVPAISARAPYVGLCPEVGRQRGDVKNSTTSNAPNNEAACPLGDEDEDADDEDDGRHAADEDEDLHGLVDVPGEIAPVERDSG